jgi:hypothetical protein
VGAGVEQQADRLDRPVALDELGGEMGGSHRLDRRRPERRRRSEVETTGEEPTQRHAGGQRPLGEPRSGEPVEQPPVDAGRSRQQADHRVVARPELLHRRGVGGSHHPGREGDRVGARFPHRLVEGGGDDADASVGRLDHPVGDRRRTVRDEVDDLGGGDRQGGGVDDRAVDELGHLVHGIGQDPAGDDQLQVVGVLDPIHQAADRLGVEQVSVVDDDSPAEVFAQLTPEAERSGRRRPPDQPRLPVSRRRFEQNDPRSVGAGKPTEQGCAGESHERLGEPIEGGAQHPSACRATNRAVRHRLRHPTPLLAFPLAWKSLLGIVVACQASPPETAEYVHRPMP